MTSDSAIITQLFVYPVKSLKGIELKEARLTRKGLDFDRRWMIIGSDGRFKTQRELARLALVNTALTDEGVRLEMPGQGSATIPFNSTGGHEVSSKVWKDDCETLDQGDEIARWLTEAVGDGTELRLVSMKTDFTRSLSKAVFLGRETTTNFADAAPYLIANQGSLDALNAELALRGLKQVPMNRFRPNIVLTGLDAFSEHAVDVLSAAEYSFSLRYPCERCVVPTIDQESAIRDPGMQPFKTLTEINAMPNNPRAPAFGENAVLESGEDRHLNIGDRLEVVLGG